MKVIKWIRAGIRGYRTMKRAPFVIAQAQAQGGFPTDLDEMSKLPITRDRDGARVSGVPLQYVFAFLVLNKRADLAENLSLRLKSA